MPTYCECIGKAIDDPTMCGGCTPDYEQDDDCDHEHFDIDILSGRASCNDCLASWYATNEQIEAQHRHEIEYAEWVDQQQRRERWEWLARPWRWFWYRALLPLSPRKATGMLHDDEIPF